MEPMSFWEGALKGAAIVFFKKFLVYVKAQFGEPVFWIIVGIVVVLVILGIVGHIAERRHKNDKKEDTLKATKCSADGQVICPFCSGYGEVANKGKRADKGTPCPHCLGTGWIGEK